MKKAPHFTSEKELCAAFIAVATAPMQRRDFLSWTAYPETAGFDILLVRADGCQIGIQAKLKLNADVLSQILEGGHSYWREHGPDFRAVLVPSDARNGLAMVLPYLGITLLAAGMEERWQGGAYVKVPTCHYNLPQPAADYASTDWHHQLPTKRCPLPEYVPDVAAGSSAPIQLTTWKVQALKLAILLEHRGFLTKADFKRVGIDYRRWTAPGNGWLQVTDRGYVAGQHMPPFKAQHPEVWEQIKADTEKWLPPDPVGTLALEAS